jgi:hypothetical protein
MAFQFSVAARNASLDAVETAIGTAPTLRIRSGTVPANCAAARSGTVLAEMVLPSDWAAAASSGSKTLLGTWQDLAADAAGTAGHFEIVQGATCHIQGTVTATSGGGDMEIQNTNIAIGQQVTVTAFTINAGGA